MTKTLKNESTLRAAAEVGKGDFVKVRGVWKKIASNTATGLPATKYGRICTTDGGEYSMWKVNRYAKAKDMK